MLVCSHTGSVGDLEVSFDAPGDFLDAPDRRVYYYPEGPVINGWQVSLINGDTDPTLITTAVPGVSHAPVYTRKSRETTLLRFDVDAKTGALTFTEVTF